MDKVDVWKQELKDAARPEKVKILSSFFKTYKGGYGEGDIFIGIIVPDNRKIAKKYSILPLHSIQILLCDPIHEFRLSALLALVEKFKKASAEEKAEKERAWLQKENEDKKRQKCAQEKKSTRKKEAVRLRYKEC